MKNVRLQGKTSDAGASVECIRFLLGITFLVANLNFCFAAETNKTNNSLKKNTVSYLGRINPPLPRECRLLASAIILEHKDLAYSIVRCNGRRIFWLEKSSYPEQAGRKWVVVDELHIPEMYGDDAVLGYECSYKNIADPMIFVILKNFKKNNFQVSKNVLFAFKVDGLEAKISRLDARKVSCAFDNDYYD